MTYTGSKDTGFGEDEKTLTDNTSVSYKYYVETKNSDRYFTITVGDSVASATITVYTSHTSKNSVRSLYIGKTNGSVEEGTYIDTVSVGEATGDVAPANLYTISATATGGETLYVYAGTSDTMHVYAIVVSYTIA
ncbi:MAG: hypothetical protein LUD72_11860 [Bacteroidales bacterium]|nr:hypothetical protein [Bacteroidales bacterium]